MLLINAAAHFLVDAACAAALFGSGAADMAMLLLLYNGLAFSTQCLVGLLTDRTGGCVYFNSASCAVVALGVLLPLPPMVKAAVVGIGNSFFHVSAGTVTLTDSGGSAAPLGIFVAPGSLGLALGTLFPSYGRIFAVLLFICAAAVLWAGMTRGERRSEAPADTVSSPERGGLIAALLLIAVAARAVGGSAVAFPWKTGAAATVIMALSVLAGKAAGGFICDRLGAGWTALISIPAAALLITFGADSIGLSLLGQFLLNLSMPVTLLLIYRALPTEPGFAFGLAASALWPGTIAGQLIQGAGNFAKLWIPACFLFGLAAIIYGCKGEQHEKAS